MFAFIEFQFNSDTFKGKKLPFYSKGMSVSKENTKIIKELENVILEVTKSIDNYRFHDAAEVLYEFAWHKVADIYIEELKDKLKEGDEEALIVLRHVWIVLLKLLHPFMPFITEELWSKLPRLYEEQLIVSKWPHHE